MEQSKLSTTVIICLLLLRLAVHATAKSSACPSYCACTDASIECRNGYVINSTVLYALPPTLENITVHNFIIRELTASYFKRFIYLKRLSLTECRMKSLNEGSFEQLPLLDFIDIQRNDIVKLPHNLFDSQKTLSSLNLAHNLIKELPETIFHNITMIESLVISYNRLQLLPSKIFNNLVNLKHLDLSHNEISYILPSTFNFISHIRYIDLSDNLLVTIHEDLFDSNNVTVETMLSVSTNPLDCNCGMVWLKKALLGDIKHITLNDSNTVVCTNPEVYHNKMIIDVPLEQLNCTMPTAKIVDASINHFYASKVQLQCHTSGSPTPSVVWETPMLDHISDPYRGEWLDGSINTICPEKKYRIVAIGEVVSFTVETHEDYSTLYVDTLHLVSSGLFKCIAINPGGLATAEVNITMISPIMVNFHPSLIVAGVSVVIAIGIGIVGCSVTACVERCSCCPSMMLKYYDGSWMNCRQNRDEKTSAVSGEPDLRKSNKDCDMEHREGDELLGAGSASISSSDPSTSSQSYTHPYHGEINENTALTAEEWDDYFRQFPDDFVVESFDASPKKISSPHGSPTHRSHGKTIETLEGVRVRLKLRVEQIDVMKERLRVHMEKRSARMKENMERRKIRMNKRMQTIKETTSQSLQSIRETGRSYSHKLHMGVRTAMENVGAQVQSLKEFCGTGDLGQTVSIATITTDIDTNEKSEIARSVTMV